MARLQNHILGLLGIFAAAIPAAQAADAPAAEAPVVPRSAEVILRVNPQAPELAVVRSVYSAFLANKPGLELQTAMIDLDGDRRAEVVARFRYGSTCAQVSEAIQSCHTVVLRFDGKQWAEIFARRAVQLSTGAATVYPRAGGKMLDILVNGRERWTWNGGSHYGVTLDGAGTYAELKWLPPREVTDPALGAFDRASKGAAASIRAAGDQGLRAAQIDLTGPGGATNTATGTRAAPRAVRGYLVAANQGSGLCGVSQGCPAVVVIPSAQGWKVVSDVQLSVASDVVLPTVTNGMRDIAMGDKDGYRTLSWNGSAYQLVATTYPSRVTPAP